MQSYLSIFTLEEDRRKYLKSRIVQVALENLMYGYVRRHGLTAPTLITRKNQASKIGYTYVV